MTGVELLGWCKTLGGVHDVSLESAIPTHFCQFVVDMSNGEIVR